MSAPDPFPFSSMRELQRFKLLGEATKQLRAEHKIHDPQVEERNMSIDPKDRLIRQLHEEKAILQRGNEMLKEKLTELWEKYYDFKEVRDVLLTEKMSK